jgi:uncharacterized protein
VALLAVPFGLAIGLSLGVLGGGGAVLALPVLVYVLGQDVHAATTASLAVVAAAALAGGAMQASRARVCWPQVALLTPAALAGTVLGTLAGQAVSDAVLLLGFVPVLVVAAISTWRRSGDGGNGGACPRLDPERALAAGGAVGLLTGFFGVGGGFLVVPVLVLALRFPLRRAIGTSLVIVGLVSVGGFVVHLWNGSGLEVDIAVAMAMACAAGALVGARLAERVPQRALEHAFAVLLIALAVYMLAAGTLA